MLALALKLHDNILWIAFSDNLLQMKAFIYELTLLFLTLIQIQNRRHCSH